MGVNQELLRADGKAGSVDLSVLAYSDRERVKGISLRTASGLWYELSPLGGTTLHADNTIAPVHLEFGPWAREDGGLIEETKLALWFIKKWVTERRHFPRIGEITLANAVIHEGDRVNINGRNTSSVDVAWVTEYTENHDEAPTSTIDLKTGEMISLNPVRIF